MGKGYMGYSGRGKGMMGYWGIQGYSGFYRHTVKVGRTYETNNKYYTKQCPYKHILKDMSATTSF